MVGCRKIADVLMVPAGTCIARFECVMIASWCTVSQPVPVRMVLHCGSVWQSISNIDMEVAGVDSQAPKRVDQLAYGKADC